MLAERTFVALITASVDYVESATPRGSSWPKSAPKISSYIGIAPELSAHNDEILAQFGYTPAQIEGVRERKII